MRKRSWSKNEPRARWVRERISSYRARWAPGVTSLVGGPSVVRREAGAHGADLVADLGRAAACQHPTVAAVGAGEAAHGVPRGALVDGGRRTVGLDDAAPDDRAVLARLGDRAAPDEETQEKPLHGRTPWA